MFTYKPKLDPKVRFQQKSFRQQLQNAKGYKRNVRKPPENQLQIFLDRIGLKNVLAQMLLGVLVLGLIYIIYIPNFLFIKTVEVQGLETEQNHKAEDITRQFIKSSPMKARDNILFVPKKSLSNFLPQNDNDILEVTSISRSLPNKIIVKVRPRQNAFLVAAGVQKFVVSTDGLVRRELDVFATSTPQEFLNLVPVTVKNASSTQEGDNFFSSDTSQLLLALVSIVTKNPALHIQNVLLENPDARETVFILQDGYEIRLNMQQDLVKINSALQLILNDVGARQKDLYYIDMRFPDRAFACYKNTPCANDKPVIEKPLDTTATSTIISN